jgi:hypothetical protein
MVALRLRRLDRRLGSHGRAGALPGFLQRRVRRLPRPHRLSRVHRSSTSTRTRTPFFTESFWKSTPTPGKRDCSAAPSPPWPRAHDANSSWVRADEAAISGTSGRRSTRRWARMVTPRRSGTNARRHRPQGRRILEAALRPHGDPAPRLGTRTRRESSAASCIYM